MKFAELVTQAPRLHVPVLSAQRRTQVLNLCLKNGLIPAIGIQTMAELRRVLSFAT